MEDHFQMLTMSMEESDVDDEDMANNNVSMDNRYNCKVNNRLKFSVLLHRRLRFD